VLRLPVIVTDPAVREEIDPVEIFEVPTDSLQITALVAVKLPTFCVVTFRTFRFAVPVEVRLEVVISDEKRVEIVAVVAVRELTIAVDIVESVEVKVSITPVTAERVLVTIALNVPVPEVDIFPVIVESPRSEESPV
jgi:hypothetical protein